MDKILVTIVGIAGIVGTYWFFLGRKEQVVTISESVDISVDGGYTPEAILVPKGKPVKLNFYRKDPSSCLEEIVIPDFHIKRFLPLNKKETVEINPQNSGEYPWACGMNMYHGKIIVKD